MSTQEEEARPFFRPADDEDEWAWRARLRRNPTTRPALRLTVALVGLVLVGGGLVLVPLPGPGWLIVIVGIAVWASEIMPAQRLLDFAKDRLRRWERWMREQPRWVQLAVAAATFAFVAAVVWVVAKVLGVPGFVPDVATAWLEANLGL